MSGFDFSAVDPFTVFLIKYRWVLLIFFAMPFSLIFELFFMAREWYIHKTNSGNHEGKVAKIQKAVRTHKDSNSKELLCTARPDWMSMRFREGNYKKKTNTVTMDLYDILSFNESKQTIRVEPLVSVGQLTRYLIPKGWTLPVLPELDDLTVGGLICGYGIETSSHKYGLFFDNVASVDVVLGDGSLVTATPTNEYKDLFFALPWSYGALGLLVAAELKVIPMKRYVELTYNPYHNAQEMYKEFGRLSMQADKGPMFVECLAFSPNDSVLMVGNLVDKPDPAKINEIGKYYKPWFYKHVESYLTRPAQKQPFVEYIPLRDYYHRHTRSFFWASEMMLPFGNHWLFRYTLGWMLPLKVGLLKMAQPEPVKKFYERTHVFQDILVPLNKFEQSMDYVNKNFDMFPMWLCPHKTEKTDPEGMLRPHDKNAKEWEMYVDIGLYGPAGPAKRGKPFDTVQSLRNLEAYLRKNGSYQALYATTEMTRPEWEEMFHQDLYKKCRTKYGGAGVFMDAYDKVKKNKS